MSEQAIRTIISVDAGGTKTLARLTDIDTNQSVEMRSGSGSLTNDTSAACQTITLLINDLVLKHGISPESTTVVCGAAGAEEPVQKQQLLNAINHLGFARVHVTSDAHISLLGATGGDYGVCVAIGTGSVALRYGTDQTITQFGGWGFQVGDQGSGADIGRHAVREVLKALDRDKHTTPFVLDILEIIGSERAEILQWVKQATPASYAALGPTVLVHRAKSEIAQQILQQALADIRELIELARGDSNLPVYLMGGMGNAVLELLGDGQNDWLRAAKGNALDGALLLGRQLLED